MRFFDRDIYYSTILLVSLSLICILCFIHKYLVNLFFNYLLQFVTLDLALLLDFFLELQENLCMQILNWNVKLLVPHAEKELCSSVCLSVTGKLKHRRIIYLKKKQFFRIILDPLFPNKM